MIKRVLSVILLAILLLLISIIPVSAAAKDVYYIYSENDFDLLALYPDAHFCLTDDIYFSVPIETYFSEKDKPFSGTLDGCGHKISYATIESEGDVAAFIGYLTGTIKSLEFSRVTVKTVNDSATVAGIVAFNYGVIEDCTFSGNIYRANIPVYGKGIAAESYGNIIGCSDETMQATDVTSSDIVTSETSSFVNSSGTETSSFESVSSSEDKASSSATLVSSDIYQVEYDISSNSVSKDKDSQSSSKKETSSNKKTSSKNKTSSKVKTSSKSAVTSKDATSSSARENAQKYFDDFYDDEPKFSKNATALLVAIAIVGLSALCAVSFYKEKKTKNDKK